MVHFSRHTFLMTAVLGVTALGLSACSSTSADQQALTAAQMTGEGATCNELAQQIHTMDQIIIDNGGSNTNYGNAASQTVNTGLATSGVLQKVPGLSTLTSTTRAWTQGSGNNLSYQQANQARQEKNRLIRLFQQKGCRLVNN